MVPGFENMKMFRPGYAIEYDYFPPTQLDLSLETRLVKRLFFAGQINGTTGYEEAASQGLVAGINAHLAIHEKEPFILKRSEAYIGVLIDDLVNKGTKEPYRMFTSRAEYRILLRQDNADVRLTPLASNLGMLYMEERMDRVRGKNENVKEIVKFFEETSISPDQVNDYLTSIESSPLNQKVKLQTVLLRPGVDIDTLAKRVDFVGQFVCKYDKETLLLSEVGMKYEGYIEKEQEMVQKIERLEAVKLSEDFDYRALQAMSMEAREKLSSIKPKTIGQASRISGVSPSDISILLIHVRN